MKDRRNTTEIVHLSLWSSTLPLYQPLIYIFNITNSTSSNVTLEIS